MAKKDSPQILSLDPAQLEQLLGELQKHLPDPLYQTVAGLVGTLQWLLGLIEKKNTSLRRLRRMIFGQQTEKTRVLFEPEPAAVGGSKPPPKKPPKGHGRNGAAQYRGARRIPVPHPTLHPGAICPECREPRAKLRHWVPALILRVTAQPLMAACVYGLEQLRCGLCGKLFTAPLPPEAGTCKYDPNVGLMLGFLRFGCGLPHYRMEKMQRDFGVPLPQSTQWELMAEAARDLEPVQLELIRLAAQGELLHNDDTTMRVQRLKQQQAQTDSPRTGIFTTGIISEVAEHRIALFFTGPQHAGENLDQLLQQRAVELARPIQMCDALSRNPSKEFEVLLANCLPHGRRKFVEVIESFPSQCHKVLQDLSLVFKNDALAREQGLGPQQRLELHQQQSQPVMNQLKEWMQQQLDQHLVEPNSGLGEAIAYMLKHWEPLTLFLRQPGAPLSNNICERALKMAILHRKNSLGYKTQNGARVGDLFMSLIHTCRLAALNVYDYLTSLQRHAAEVRQNPGQWLPWNYPQAAEPSNTS